MDFLRRRRLMMAGSTEHDYSKDYLTFTFSEAGTFTLGKSANKAPTCSIDYSTDGGSTWSTLTSSTIYSYVNVSNGTVLLVKGSNSQYASNNSSRYNHFVTTANFELSGNIMSLVNNTSFSTAYTLSSSYTLCSLFRSCTKLTNAENLVLPATTLASNCYDGLFYGCTALVTGPKILPATSLTSNCYRSMYYGCTSLTGAPILPATTISAYGYYNMFYNCSSLNYIKCLCITTGNNSTTNWVYGVAASGTFVKNTNKTNWGRDTHGIPVNWTVENATS